MLRKGTWFALAVGLSLGPNAAAAADDDVQATLRQMQERLAAVEDQLGAANARVAEQERVIQGAGLGTPDVSAGTLGSWVDSLEFDGWVSATYWYNFNDPDNDALIDANRGVAFQSNPFNPDANQFSFDQLWFSFGKPVSEDSRAGFFAEIVYGKVAKLLPLGNAAAGGNNLYIGSAYAQYLTPFGPTVKFGKFPTLIGAEVAGAPLNWNISRGLVYNLLQPIDHTGILLSGAVGESGFDYAFGVVNDVFTSQPTVSDGKAYTGHLGYGQDNWSIGLNAIYGATASSLGPAGDEEARRGIIDLLFKMDPTEKFSFWVNADWSWNDGDYDGIGAAGDTAWGVAVAGRYAITERLGYSMRVEYVQDECCFFGFEEAVQFWGITGTVDYALTENLTVKGELRWDTGRIDKAPDDLFISDSGSGYVYSDQSQAVIGVEAIYRF